ncbi:ATPase [Marinitoga sp. 1197]|uniref:ATP-binding cassette domain-containing protein n=1 Tax=Marinitoga sp. 1197 TaxID=1428449 RepID=UPI0006417064|nr:ATP-binding cassette domain-containing protein [Marinitoga sp. 1197]KLO22711.1 ATPase [Marinitoga sp. 1197]
MLELKNCYKKYGEKIIFENISYVFYNNIYWLKGENGIGKSVFLRCISNIEKFSGGIYKNNLKRILYIPEFSLNENWLTLKENIELFMFYHSINIRKDFIEKVLKKLNIEDASIFPYKASVGTNLKTIFSLIFIPNMWDMIIIDEAISHLDLKTQNILFAELNQRSSERTIVIFTYHGNLNSYNFIELTLKKEGMFYD